MTKYTYIDYRLGPVVNTATAKDSRRSFPVHTGEVIFECIAHDIIEADSAFKRITGIDPNKIPEIACSLTGAQAWSFNPFAPCPICKGIEGCDHSVPERRQKWNELWASSL